MISNKIILALGADIKNRFLFANGKTLYAGPDIGDLSDADNFQKFKKAIAWAVKSSNRKPDIIAYDLNPGYFSTEFAKSGPLPFTTRYKLIGVQHHHAHIASVILENNIKRPVIGVAFDGTGFGTDANIWGGEFLYVDNKGFERLAHLKYRKLPGADKVVYEPWRMVLSILGKKGLFCLKGVSREKIELIFKMMQKDLNSPLSSSAGRLFDAAAALLGLCQYASYEAEGPVKLEKLCDESIKDFYDSKGRCSSTKVCAQATSPTIIDTDDVFLQMVNDIKNEKAKNYIATKFHNTIAAIIADTSKKLCKRTGLDAVALSGGVFQNRFLTKRVMEKLKGVKIFMNKSVSNDFNVALGQYYVSCNSGKN